MGMIVQNSQVYKRIAGSKYFLAVGISWGNPFRRLKFFYWHMEKTWFFILKILNYLFLSCSTTDNNFSVIIFTSKVQRKNRKSSEDFNFLRPILYKPFEINREGFRIGKRSRWTWTVSRAAFLVLLMICKIRIVAFHSSNIGL